MAKNSIYSAINPKYNDNNCSQYALPIGLNYQNIKRSPQRISNIRPFIDQYGWKERNFPSHKVGWKKFESNNKLHLMFYLCHTILKK